MREQQKAEAYVREECPELKLKGRKGFIKGDLCPDCKEELGDDNGTIFCGSCPMQISDKTNLGGHPIQLQHWLRVLFEKTPAEQGWWYIDQWGNCENKDTGECFHFNLTTSQPATEADYKAFNDIVGI